MPYIGNEPAVLTTKVEYQDLTGVTGVPAKRGYTLDHSVGSANEIEVFVNNVRQEPGVAYNTSGGTTSSSSSGGGGGVFKGDNGTVNAGKEGDIFRVHQQQLDTDTTIDADENALAAGPLTVATGVTLTVTSGGNLVIA